MTDLISIGGARLKAIGLRPTRISRRSERRVPGTPTFYDMDYQETGAGERVTSVSAETMPHIFGGLDAVSMLEAHHLAGSAVMFLRMSRNFLTRNLGLVVIRTLDVNEEALHPADGIGRKVQVEIELVHIDQLSRPFGAAG